MSAGLAAEEEEEAVAAAASPALPRVLSALFYGTCSFLTLLVNKALLSAYSFPSPMFLGIGQMAATILILYVSKLNKIVHFPDFDKSIPVKFADVYSTQEVYHSTYFTAGSHHTWVILFVCFWGCVFGFFFHLRFLCFRSYQMDYLCYQKIE
uniref:Solute carrier family 35 member D2 n=1 Tax=Taeniopygia guttata TaxID=59729 RepID=A0A674HR12_TAEGU